MYNRVIREPRKQRVRRTPDPGAGIRYQDLQARRDQVRTVFRDKEFAEHSTLFGKISYISKQGNYEVAMEVMAAHTNTGLISSNSGCCTVICKSGILYVERHIGDTIKYDKLQSGNIAEFTPGDIYSLAAGNTVVDFMRVQTASYLDNIKYNTESVIPIDAAVVSDIHVASLKEFDANDIANRNVNVSGRKSYNPAYRSQIASMVAADKKANAKNRPAREARIAEPGKSQEEMFQSQMEFTHNKTVVSGFNPRPLGADGAEALMAADLANQATINPGNVNE